MTVFSTGFIYYHVLFSFAVVGCGGTRETGGGDGWLIFLFLFYLLGYSTISVARLFEWHLFT